MAPTILEFKNHVRHEKEDFWPLFQRKENMLFPPPLEPRSPSTQAYFSHIIFLKKAFACYTTLLLCKYLFQYYFPIHHKRSATTVHSKQPHANHLIMFYTDVPRAWAECSLKDFSQTCGGGAGSAEELRHRGKVA